MMKVLTILLLTISVSTFSITAKASVSKDPIVIEVPTEYTSVEEALQAAKTALLKEKFITANGIQKAGFTATRTTGAKADYYVADVTAKQESGKVKITVSFVKVGTGLLRLQKVADSVKAQLEK